LITVQHNFAVWIALRSKNMNEIHLRKIILVRIILSAIDYINHEYHLESLCRLRAYREKSVFLAINLTKTTLHDNHI
jgi:hypothetical protein